MPRKSKDGPGRDDAGGLPGRLDGDEDYDWIRYLGEGRGSASASAGSGAAPAAASRRSATAPASASGRSAAAAPASRPDAVPAPAATSPAARRAPLAPRRVDVAGRAGRAGRAEPPAGGRGTQDGRPAGGSAGSGIEAGYGNRPARQVPAGRTAPGRAVRVTQGRAVDLVSGDAIAGGEADLLFNPAADDYRQPLYLDPAPRPDQGPAGMEPASFDRAGFDRDSFDRDSADRGRAAQGGPPRGLAGTGGPSRGSAGPGWPSGAAAGPARTAPDWTETDWAETDWAETDWDSDWDGPGLAERAAEPGWSQRAPADRNRSQRAPGDPGWPALGRPDVRLDTAEYASPLYPAQDSGLSAPVLPRGPVPGDDPLADTDPRQRPGAAPLPGRDAGRRTGPQPRVAGPVPLGQPGRPGPAGLDDGAGSGPGTAGLAGGLGLAEPGAAGSGTRALPGFGRNGEALADDAAVAAGPEIDAGWQVPVRSRPARKPGKAGKSAKTKPRKPAATRPAKAGKPGVAGQKRLRSGRKAGRRLLAVTAVLVLLAAGVATYLALRPGTKHLVSTPAKLGSYSRQQADATAVRLKQQIVTEARGAVKNVVAAVYKRTAGPGTSKGPQVVVFIGGNLAGSTSAASLISAYMARLSGAFTTSPGTLGGQAACAPGSSGGRPAECAWADGDTFGVVVSATMTSAALADEMRLLRPQVEHAVR